MFTKEMATELAAKFDNSQHLHLPEAGHLLIAEYAEIVNREIANFIFLLTKTTNKLRLVPVVSSVLNTVMFP